MNELWKNLTSGKFWASGSMYYNSKVARYTPTIAEHASWDSGTSLGEKNPAYIPDSQYYFNVLHLRYSLTQCMTNYLDEQATQFVTDAYNRAYAKMQKYCNEEYIGSITVITKPNGRVPMHSHAKGKNLTFTYVVSSGTAKPNSSIVMSAPGQPDLKIQFPDSNEFFTVLDTTKSHGTEVLENDDNYYMFFVFDGITLKNNTLKMHKMYTV